jgi:L-threonylcarbamoyladenylate synthase
MVSGKPETVLVEAVGEEAAISGAAGALRAGGLVVLPTDTVYGLAAALDRPEAIARVFVAKGRPADLALPVLISEASAMERLAVDVPLAARGLTAEFWPGALTVVLPRSDLVPDEVTAGRATVGLRLPDCELARRIIAACGGALAVTSANISGADAPRTVAQMPDGLRAQVALIVDTGECPGGVPSTVVDLSVAPPRILREGAIPRQRIMRVLAQVSC